MATNSSTSGMCVPIVTLLAVLASHSVVTAELAGNCSSRGTYNAVDGTCTCDVGFGGDDCSVNLLELSSTISGPARSLQEASAAEAAAQMDPLEHAHAHAGLMMGGRGAAAAAAVSAADAPAAAPFSLRNMLMYADTLVKSRTEAAEAGGHARRLLDASDPLDAVTVGCGFYDLFYEGCANCFYNNNLACTPDAGFYDFYTGETLRHAPETEYSDNFMAGSVFGDRGFLGKANALWSSDSPAVTADGDDYLGGLSAATPLTLRLGDLPSAEHELIMSFDFVVAGASAAAFDISPVTLTVLGEGPVVASAVLDVSSANQAAYQVEFKFAYRTTDIVLKIAAAAGALPDGATWGVDSVMLTSMVTNYRPVAMDKQVIIAPDPFGGAAGNTIELAGFDQECEGMEYHITSLPTEGKLFQCGCDDLWTTPIMPSDLPAVVPGPCHRLVYEPAANEPKEDLAGAPFDAFQYRVKDGYEEYSDAAFIKIFVDTVDTVDNPVSGRAGLAIACDGKDDVVSVSWALGEPGPAFSVELRFKVTGDSVGTLAQKPGSYWLGWTEFGGLGAKVHTSSGEVKAETLSGYADRLWHHVAMVYHAEEGLTLFVDGEVVATREVEGTELALSDPSKHATLCSQLSAEGDGVVASTAFNGHIDEVRFWGRALDEHYVSTLNALGFITDADEEEDLVAYFDFNLGANVPVSSAVFDRTSGHVDAFFSSLSEDGRSSGLDAMFPTYVTSTALYSDIVTTNEDEAVTVQLHGGDLEGGVTFWVATMPVKGDIVDPVTGKTVLTSPAPISGSSVIYHPKGSSNGKDIFKYQAFDGSTFSYKTGVLLDIKPVNDPPVCFSLTTVTTSVAGTKLVQLSATDEDADAFLTFTITRPPRRGHLFQSDINGNKLSQIDLSMTVVSSTSAFVLYEPRDVGNDATEGYPFDSFAYTAADRFLANSGECVVDISIPDDGCDPKPVAGDAGYGLHFDGENDIVNLGALGSFLPGFPAAPEMSLALYFRTSSSSNEGVITLARAGPFALQMSKVYGLAISVGSQISPTFEPFNEGGWHRVVLTYDSEDARLYVDGTLRAELKDVVMPESFDDALLLGYHTMSASSSAGIGHFNGQVDEVSIWTEVIDATSEDASLAPDFSGYAANAATYPSGITGHWRFNEAQGVMVLNGVSGMQTESVGEAGEADTQPRWVASTLSIGNKWNATEGALELIQLACASEYTDTVDAVLLTLPGQAYGGGKLWYTEDGVTPLYPITQVPTVLKDAKVIYQPGTVGRTEDFITNYGDFGYTCIGDLQRTLTDHLKGFDFYGLTGATQQSALGDFLNSIGDLIRNLPTPPNSPPPVVSDLARSIYAKAPVVDKKALDNVLSFYGLLLQPIAPVDEELPELPPSPKPKEPPSVEDLAAVVLADLVESFFPALGAGVDGAVGATKIASVALSTTFTDLNATDFVTGVSSIQTGDNLLLIGTPTPALEEFLAAFVTQLATTAGVPETQVSVTKVLAGSVIVEASVTFAAASQTEAQAFQNTASTNGDLLFIGDFQLKYGTATVTDVATDATFVSVAPGTTPACFQLSPVQVVVVNVKHTNHMPTACAAGCHISITHGSHTDRVFEIDAVDEDGDELEVRITYLARKGTILAPHGTNALGEVPVQGDLFDFYISREGSLVAKDPATGKYPLVYSPQVNGAGMPYDSFGFVISDGTTISKEYTVTVDVEDSTLTNPLPTAGNTGYAVEFDGLDDFATLGPVTPYGIDEAVTFAMWVKTGSAVTKDGMTVLSAGKYRIFWTKLGGLSFSVTNAGTETVLASYKPLNDLFWHHVIAAFDGEHAMLYVDGMSVGSAMVAPAHGVMLQETAEPTLTVGAREMNGDMVEFFGGVVDELVIFNKASATLMLSTAEMRRCGGSHLACFEGDEDGLVGYWRFNEALGSFLANEIAAPEGITEGMQRLGTSDGVAATMPMRVASTVPLLNTIELLEDTEATFTLSGVSHDIEDPMVHITIQPSKGRLYVDDKRVHVGDSFPVSKAVLYKPKANFHGTENLGYVINDGTMSSDLQLVKLVVHPQNDVPDAADVAVGVDFKDPTPVEVKLKAKDVDSDDTRWLITVLPMHGTLYQGVNSSFETASRTLTQQITMPNTVVTSPVYYMPMVNDPGMQDFFNYVVEDEAAIQTELSLTSAVTSYHSGNTQTTEMRPFGAAGTAERRLRSRVATVTLDGSAFGLSVDDTPVVGLAGLALRFDGLQTVATLGNASAYGLMTPSASSPVMFSTWFKTSSVTVENRMTLLVAGPYMITWTKILGLQFSVGSSKPLATYSAFNDGVWHRLIATYDGKAMTLTVDAVELTGTAEWTAPSEDSTVLLGAEMGMSISSYYNGFVDDLVIGRPALGFFRFNEASGNVLTNEGSAGNGELGMGGVTSTQPMRVTSSAPISIGDIVLDEDTEVTVELIAFNADAAATGVTYVITALPAAGKLYTTHASTGAKLSLINAASLPKVLAAGVDKVVFVPSPNEFGGTDAPYAEFSYAADISGGVSTAARSASMTRKLYVLPVNDTPQITNRFQSVSIEEAKIATVSLEFADAQDVETESLSAMITFLPAIGLLYQYDGTLITERNTVVTDSELRLQYVPPPNVAGAPLAAFGFVFSDGQLMSEAGMVTVTVTGNSAIDLSAGGSVFVGGASTPPQLDGAFTVDAWVRIPNSGLATGVWAVVSTAFASMTSTPETALAQKWPATLALVNPMPAYEPGRWHHIAWVSQLDVANGGAMMYVDGVLVALQSVVHEQTESLDSDSSLVIGAPLESSGAAPAAFLGQVDEVRVWNRGLLQYEVIASMNIRTEHALNSATGNEAVGKGIELYLAPDLHDALVAYWSFDDIADDVIPETVAGVHAAMTSEAKITKLHYPMAPASAEAQALLPLLSTKGTGYALHLDGDGDGATAPLADADSTAGAALDFWFKIGNVQGFMALASIGGMSVHWTIAGGLGMHMNSGGSLHTFRDYSDGAWHHVKAVTQFLPSQTNYPAVGPGSWSLTLMVDDETFGPVVAAAAGSMFSESSSLTLGASTNAHWLSFGNRFCGTIDFNSATTADGMTPLAILGFDGTMSLSGMMKDMSGNGAHAELMGNPTWVFSTAPRSVPTYSCLEDSDMTAIELLAGDADGDVLKYYVTHIPDNGQLFVMEDGDYKEILMACPAGGDAHDDEAHCDPIKYEEGMPPVVYFKPRPDTYGTSLVQYVADDGMVMSDPTYIVIDVVPVNDLPTLDSMKMSVSMLELSNKPITLGSASDVDMGAELSYIVSTLPTKGKLYQYPLAPDCMQYSDGMPYPAGFGCHDTGYGGEITETGTAVADPEHRVVYVPLVNGEGPEHDLFGYQVTDGNVGTCQGEPPLPCPDGTGGAQAYYTPEALVTVSLGQVLENSVPVAGHAGYALEFDGVDDRVDVTLDNVLGPTTLELWVRTSAAVDEFTSIATMVSSGTDPDYINVHLTRFGAIGMEVAVGGVVNAVYSFTTINDGMWHHVAAVFDGAKLGVVVDGDQCDACVAEHPAGITPSLSALTLGPASPSAFSYLFAGQLDDIRLWSSAKTAEEVAASMNTLLHGDEEGLLLWFPLDGQSTKDGVIRDDAQGGTVEDGDAIGDIKWVASSAPVHTLKYNMDEDTRIAVDLYATDADFDALQYFVMSIPDSGVLYPSADSDEPIEHVPFQLPTSQVFYEAPENVSGGPMFSWFRYGAHDGSAFSNEAKVVIDTVFPTADRPSLSDVADGLTVATGNSIIVEVSGMDADLLDANDIVNLKITSLPSTGALYQVAADGVSAGEAIMTPDTPLTSTTVDGMMMSGKVMFVPDLDYSPGYASADERADEYTATFGVAIQDMNSAYLYGSDEKLAVVTVVQEAVQESPKDLTAPLGLGAAGFVSGLSGQAVLLDGEMAYIVGGNGTSNSSLFGEDGSFTVEMYFKSTAAVQERTVLASKDGALRLFWRRYYGLTATVTTADQSVVLVGSKQRYNDGAWHHVAVVWNATDSSLTMYIDNAMVDMSADPATGAIAPESGPLVIGGDGMGVKTNFFAGFVDEFKVWGEALSAEGVAETFRGIPNGDEPAVLSLRYSFDQANGSTGNVVVDSSGNGLDATHEGSAPVFLTSSTPVYMKKAIVMEDTPKTIRLAGSDIDFDALDFRITQFPEHGELYANGALIDYVPYRLSGMEVVFVPGTNAAENTTFTFVVSDGKVFSAVATVVIVMTPMADGPVALPVPAITAHTDICGSQVGNNRVVAPELGMTPKPWWESACEDGETSLFQVSLAGYDADGDDITFHVTTLPQIGKLYQAKADDASQPDLLSPITEPGMMVAAQDGVMATVWYSLQDFDYLSAPQEVFFGYAVTEAADTHLTSVEQQVAVVLTQRSDISSVFSGVKGFAIYFDGSEASLEVPVTASVSDFTVETWFKSSGALLDGATLLSTPSFRLGWTSYGGLGMHFTGINSNLHSFRHLNDGEWHHVAVSVDLSGPTTLYIDGVASAFRQVTPNIDGDVSALTVGHSASLLGARTYFRGQLDEVRMWAYAADAATVKGRMNLLVDSSAAGLAAYLRFNRGDLLTAGMTTRELANQTVGDVTISGVPHLVTSSAPVMMLVEVEENNMAVISLTGGDVSTGALLTAVITELPEQGVLYDGSTDTMITAVPYTVSDPLNNVIFASEEHTFGDEFATPTYLHSVVRFMTVQMDAMTGAMSRSDEDTIVVVVTPVNYHPTLPVVYSTMDVSSYSDVVVELEADDMDEDELTYVITTLPTYGVLYQTPDGVTRGPRITRPGTSLEAGVNHVLYSPILVDNGSWGQFTTFFGYTAYDLAGPAGAQQYAVEPEALVHFNVTVAMSEQPPVAGSASMALMFNEFGDPVALPAPAGLSNLTAMTVEMWMKTSAALARVDNAALIECDAFRFNVGRILGLSFTVPLGDGSVVSVNQDEPMTTNPDMDVNDGAWHFVAATFKTNVGGVLGDTMLELYMDGVKVGASAVVSVPEGMKLATLSENTLHVGQYFAGLVDEVRVWGQALVMEEWVANRKYNWDATGKEALSGNEAGLLAYWRFNENSGTASVFNYVTRETATVEMGSAIKVPSLAPIDDMLRVAEDHHIVYCLQGSGEQILVTMVPSNGKLFQAPGGDSPGMEIMYAPTLVSDEGGCVVYMPNKDFYGADAFAYLAHNMDGTDSAEVTVAAVVELVNDSPEVVFYDKQVVTQRNVPVTMSIVGADVDHPDTAAVTLTALPYGGYLMFNGKRITNSPATLSGVVELEYFPIANMYGSGADAMYDEFTFAVMDPDGGTSVTITVPIFVHAEKALVADFRNVIDLGGAEDPLPPTFTLEMWIKGGPLPGSKRRSLSAYQIQPENQARIYVDFATSGVNVESMASASYTLDTVMQQPPYDPQDGQWHHIAAIFDGRLKNVYIDGRLDTSQAVHPVADMTLNATVGASTLVREFLTKYLGATANAETSVGPASAIITSGVSDAVFVGAQIDDVRIYPTALSVEQLRMGMHQPAVEAEEDESLLVYKSFNDGEGDEYVPLNAAVAGEAGYAIKPSPGHVVVINDDTQVGGAPFTMDPSLGLTVSVWFRTSRACSSMGALVTKGALLGTWGSYRDSNVGGQWALQYTANGGLGFHVINTDSVIISANSYETYCDGVWHLAAGVYDSNNATLFIDGQQVASQSMKGLFVSMGGSDLNAAVVVGGDGEASKGTDFGTSVFYGHLDELKVWHYAREQPDLIEDFSMRVPTNTTDEGLRAWYRFNEASGSEAVPDQAVLVTQQARGTPPRTGSVTGLTPDGAWVASTLPVQKDFDILGFTTPLKIPIYYIDADGDIAEPVVTKLPERGTLWVSDANGQMLRQLRAQGEAITRFNTADGLPLYADHILYIPGDAVEPIPRPYATFGYAASDGREVGMPEMFTVDVFAVNEPPVVTSETISVLEDTPTQIKLKVEEPEGQSFTVSIVDYPGLGTLTNVRSGETVTELLPNENGELIVLYTPALNDVSTQSFTFKATDSEGAESGLATITLVIECVNDAPEVLLANPIQDTYRGQRVSLLIGISVFDVDSSNSQDLSVTVSVPEGALSSISSQDVVTSTLKELTFSGTEAQINQKLGRIFFFNTMGSESIPVTISANDNDNGCGNGPQVGENVLTLQNVLAPFDNVAFTDDGRSVKLTFTCEVDTTPFEGTQDCSLLLQAQTLRMLGAYDLCYATGTLQQNPLSFISCPVCSFDSQDRRTYTVTLAAGATIVPGDALRTKSNVVQSLNSPDLAPPDTCPLGDLLDDDFHPDYTLPVNPPLNAPIPEVLLDGPLRVGSCNPIKIDGLETVNGMGRMMTYSWTVEGPEPLTPAQLALVTTASGPMLELPADIAIGLYTVSATVTNWLRASSIEPVTHLVEKVDSPIPTIYIKGADTVRTKRNLRTSIKASVEATLCPGFCNDVTQLDLSWNQISQPFGAPRVVPEIVSSSGVLLRIPKNTLSATFTTNSFYEFEINAVDCVDSSVTGDAVSFVNVMPQELSAAIYGGSRDWYRSKDFILDGTYSVDPDHSGAIVPGLPAEHLTFTWSAFRDGQPDSSFGLSGESGSEITIAAGSVPEGEVEFRLTLTSTKQGDNRVAYDSVIINFVSLPLPEAWITPNLQYKLNPSDFNSFRGGGNSVAGTAITFEWSLVPMASDPGCIKQPECEIAAEAVDLDDINSVPTGRFSQNLFFNPNSLKPGRYEVELKICHAEENVCSVAKTQAVVNSPPTGGLVSVVPAVPGSACEGSEFIVMAHDFQDTDTPVLYEFGFFDETGMFLSLTGQYRTSGAVILLPSIATEVGVKVMDGLEAFDFEAAPASVIAASECNNPDNPEEAFRDTLSQILDVVLPIAVGLGDTDLALQAGVVSAGVIAGNPPTDTNPVCNSNPDCLFRTNTRADLVDSILGLRDNANAGMSDDLLKEIQALAVLSAEPEEVSAATIEAIRQGLAAAIAEKANAFTPLSLDEAGMSVHVISNMIEFFATDGSISQAETNTIFDLSLDVGRGVMSYSSIPSRVSLTLPMGRPPVLPAGASKLKLSVGSAFNTDSPAMLTVGNFDVPQGTVGAMAGADSRRRLLADLSNEAPEIRAVLVSPNFEGTVPPPVNMYGWISDPDGEPITAITGLRAYTIADCPAKVAAYDHSTGSRQACDAWFALQQPETFAVTALEEPIATSMEPLRVSLTQVDGTSFDPDTEIRGCKVVTAGDLEWNTDTVSTDLESSGIVCESRTFGDFAAFAVPKPQAPPPAPVDELTKPPSPPPATPPPPPPAPEEKPFPILAVIIPIAILVFLLVLIAAFLLYRRRKTAQRVQEIQPADYTGQEPTYAGANTESQPMLGADGMNPGPVGESVTHQSAGSSDTVKPDIPAPRSSDMVQPLPPGMIEQYEDDEASSLLRGPRSGAEL